jgi:biotin carboxylase
VINKKTEKPNKLLLVGASLAQVGGIKIAQKLGFIVVAIDGDPYAPGLKLADIGIVSDVKDYEKAIEIAKKYQVTAATTIASEICLPTVAAINQVCGLPGLLKKEASLATDKGAMRIKYQKNQVPNPRFFILKNEDDLIEAAKQVGYLSVIKPVDSSGSRGVTLIHNFDELKKGYHVARTFSRSGEVILEEFMDGLEVSVEAFVIQGKIHILTLSDKLRTKPPYLLDTCVMFPSAYPEDLQEKIKKVACSAIRSLDLDNCPIHMELLLTKEGPKIVELGARGPGFKVYTDIIPHVTGVDPVEVQLRLLCGELPEIKVYDQLKGACIRFWEGKNGIVQSISGVEEAKQLPGVTDLDLYVTVGDHVQELKSGADRIGHLISYGETRDDAVHIAERVFDMININIKQYKDEE